jgi:hypothetical protein
MNVVEGARGIYCVVKADEGAPAFSITTWTVRAAGERKPSRLRSKRGRSSSAWRERAMRGWNSTGTSEADP